jgi:hypothetical protein
MLAGLIVLAISGIFSTFSGNAPQLSTPIAPTQVALATASPTETQPPPSATPTVTVTATATATPTASPTPSPTATPTPLPIKTVRLAWFYKPPRPNDFANLARYFDLFILTHLDEPARDALRALGVRQPFLQYLRFDAIHDPGDCAKVPYHNQIAMNPGEYCAITRDHPDWFLRDVNGNLITEKYDGTRYVYMDPGNSSWRAYWLQRARQVHEQFGWDGIFLDNVEATRRKLVRNGFTPVHYPDDATYQTAIEGFLAYIANTYTQPRHKPLYANIIELGNSPAWFRYLPYLDGAMEETFAVDFKNDYLPLAIWERGLERLEQTQALGKQVILVAQGTRDDLDREKFAFASYLLINNGRATFRYSNDQHYAELWLYENYALDLGQPMGVRYRVGATWQRDFAKGTVSVDPIAHTAMITVR